MNTAFIDYSFRQILLLVSFVFLCGKVSAQQNDFDKRYNEIYVRIAALDGPEALRQADSLLSISRNDEQLVKAHMLLGGIYHSLGNKSAEFDEALKAQKIANAASNPSWQASISGFLATSFRHVGLMHESKKNLILAEEANERQRTSPNYILTKINIEHEKALYAMDNNAYEEALTYLDVAKKNIHFEKNETPKSLLIKSTNDQLYGVCYLNLGKLDLADSLFRVSLSKIQGEESNLKPYIYRGMAEVAMGKGIADSALHYLHLAEPYLESSDREELKLMVYESYARYHKLFGKSEDAIKYQDMYVALKDAKERSAKEIMDGLVSKLTDEKDIYENKLVLFGVVFVGILLVLFILQIYLIRKRKNEKQLYTNIVDRLKDDVVTENRLMPYYEHKYSHPQTDGKDPMMSKETEERLLSLLNEMEAEEFFLDKNISLTKLVNRFGTNQRYVSYLIRKYRGKDFNSYIQHCRIHYIMNRIQSDETLLNHKLSYLADMAGFSSHSKFSSVFKSVTGLPPSAFLQFAKEEKNKS